MTETKEAFVSCLQHRLKCARVVQNLDILSVVQAEWSDTSFDANSFSVYCCCQNKVSSVKRLAALGHEQAKCATVKERNLSFFDFKGPPEGLLHVNFQSSVEMPLCEPH